MNIIRNKDNMRDVHCPNCNALLISNLAGWNLSTCRRCGDTSWSYRMGRLLIQFNDDVALMPGEIERDIVQLMRDAQDWEV